MTAFPGCLVCGMAAAALLLAGGCQGSKRSPSQKAKPAAALPDDNRQRQAKAGRQQAAVYPGKPGPAQQIPPGMCRVTGQVAAILPQRDANQQAPCGQVPCRALVRVVRVLGYGTAFQPPLVPGQELKVYFAFTLSPTKKYFPELITPLPGLQAGSVFEADISALPDAGPSGWYQVKAYRVP